MVTRGYNTRVKRIAAWTIPTVRVKKIAHSTHSGIKLFSHIIDRTVPEDSEFHHSLLAGIFCLQQSQLNADIGKCR